MGSMVKAKPFLNARRQFLQVLILPPLALVVLLSGMAVSRPAFSGELAADAEEFIHGMAKTAIIRLTDKEITRDERKVRMRALMDEYFYIPGIAQWVLGRFWRQASSEERAEYVILFEDLMVESYVDRFASYNGESLTIVKTDIRNGKDAIVSSTLVRPESSDPVELDWRVRARGGAYKVVDIIVEGISMGQTQRAEFASAIKNNGGDISKFLAELRERVVIAASGA